MSSGQGEAEETKLKFIYQCAVIRSVQVQESKCQSRAHTPTQVKPMGTEDRHKLHRTIWFKAFIPMKRSRGLTCPPGGRRRVWKRKERKSRALDFRWKEEMACEESALSLRPSWNVLSLGVLLCVVFSIFCTRTQAGSFMFQSSLSPSSPISTLSYMPCVKTDLLFKDKFHYSLLQYIHVPFWFSGNISWILLEFLFISH